MQVSKTYDYIIVGAGSAGCVIANRLSADPNVSVCLLEAGGSNDHWSVRTPAALLYNLRSKARNWKFESVPQTGLGDRRSYQPRGKVLGGSSSLNGMVYMRGNRADFDYWAALGNEGWAYDDVLPLFRKSEHHEAGANAYHGTGGELNVAPVRSIGSVNAPFFEACAAMEIPTTEDFNGTRQEGVGYIEVTQKDGERHDTARAFLDPIRSRSNLTIMSKAFVERVRIEDGRAVGVSALLKGRKVDLDARSEVILSAGVYGSPQLLLLSGIGAPDKLSPHGIAVQRELPGVGENLHDHIDHILLFRSPAPDNFGLSMRGARHLMRAIMRYRRDRSGLIGSNLAECCAFIYADRSEPSPDIQFTLVRALVDDHGRKLHLGHGFSLHVTLMRPKSRGTLWLDSADASTPPAIDPAYLSEDSDIDALLAGVQIGQRTLRHPAFDPFRGEALYASDADDVQELRDDIRARADTVYHPVGTCKMGSDEMAVVDSQLRVHGIRSLRVADASIMPQIVSGNTNAASIMIGEKCASIIADHGRAGTRE